MAGSTLLPLAAGALLAGALLAGGLLLDGCAGRGDAASEETLAVRRGALEERLLLTGELVASQATNFFVPQTPIFQLQIRWLAENGTQVAAGERVIELDNTSIASELEQKRQAAKTAAEELEKKRAASRTALAEKRFAVEQKEAAVTKARLKAAVPKELMALREWQEAQLALARAESDLAKAREDLQAEERGGVADLAVAEIDLARKSREIETALTALDALTLRAPRPGIVLISEHPWEGRKLQVGDTVWPGMTVATLPESTSLKVEASLSDVDIGRIAPGRPAVVVPDAWPELRLPARVTEVSAVARETDRQPLLRHFPVRLEILAGDTSRLRPGMSVRVELVVARAADALLVPRAALAGRDAKPAVELASGRRVPVAVRFCDAMLCAVTGELSAGQALRPAPEEKG